MASLADAREFEFGYRVLEPLLTRYANVGLTLPHRFLRDHISRRAGYDIFVSCFSDARDSAQHWREYADEGRGGALGIAASALSRDGEAALLKVAYGEDEVRAAMTRVIDWSILKLLRAKEMPKAQAKLRVEGVLTAAATVLFLQVVASKREHFRGESEWRLVHFHNADVPLSAEQLGTYERGPDTVKFVLLRIPREDADRLRIVELIRGPVQAESGDGKALLEAAESRGISDLCVPSALVGTEVLAEGAT